MKNGSKTKIFYWLVKPLFIMFIAIVLSTIAVASTLEGQGISPPLRKLLDAICVVESGCENMKVGDNGKAIGPYQIWEPYWKDATEHDLNIGGVYLDCYNKKYAEMVVIAYWNRYATVTRLGHEPTLEDLARLHNGGPDGYKQKSTKIFWAKVKKQLDG